MKFEFSLYDKEREGSLNLFMELTPPGHVSQTSNAVVVMDEQIIMVSKGEKSSETAMEDILKSHPRGYLIVIFKAARQMFLAKDGKIAGDVTVNKSSLEQDYLFLRGKEEDAAPVDFPIRVALGRNPTSPRTRQGDMKTPEGEYFVCRKNKRGETGFTVALEVSYPNSQDAEKALKERRINKSQYDQIVASEKAGKCPNYYTPLGGLIKIHGLPNGQVNEWKKKQLTGYHEYLKRENFQTNYVTEEDWTFGCIAIEHSPLFYMLKEVPVGTPIIIKP